MLEKEARQLWEKLTKKELDIDSLLEKGYKATFEEDLAITKEFESADFEHED